MPRCGAYVINCDIPIRTDSYRGCGYDCAYCNEHIRGRSSAEVFAGEGIRALRAFIRGERDVTTIWCDWDIPLHWGILSEPFQPCEVGRRRSLRFLREFAESGYPVIISTKNPLMLQRGEYRGMLRHCNVVLQVSMTSPAYGEWERCPSFRDRFASLYGLSRLVRRLVVRAQPYTREVRDDVIRFLPGYAASGVHGIVIEGMKSQRKTVELTERYGASMVYPVAGLIADFFRIRQACHANGLVFYAAEDRLRYMGDSPTCCGCDGLEGFRENVANLNHSPIVFTERMSEKGTGAVFRNIRWDTVTSRRMADLSYREVVERYAGLRTIEGEGE